MVVKPSLFTGLHRLGSLCSFLNDLIIQFDVLFVARSPREWQNVKPRLKSWLGNRAGKLGRRFGLPQNGGIKSLFFNDRFC
jgi:hypothetical protein